MGIGHPDLRYKAGYWGVLLDYYHNRFLDYVLQRKSTFEEGLKSFKDEYRSISDQANKWLDRWIIRMYFTYAAIREKLTPKKGRKTFKASPQNYYKRNKMAVRLCVSMGRTSQIIALRICSFFYRFDISFWLMIGIFNAIAVIMWMVQRNIDKTFKTTLN